MPTGSKQPEQAEVEASQDHACLILLEMRPAKYVSFRAIWGINIPRWSCSQCDVTFAPDLIALDTFPGKKKKLNNLVREMGAWGMVMTDEQVSQFLRDGEAPWELTQTEPCRPARLLHHGKLLHRASQSIQGAKRSCTT